MIAASSRALPTLVVPLLALFATSCRSNPPSVEERLDVPVPESWTAAEIAGAVSADPWWLTLGEPGLAAAVEVALSTNWELEAARRTIEVAALEARIAFGAELPSADLGVEAQRSQQVFVGLPIPGGPNVLQSRATSYGVSFNVAWEVDLWGRLAAEAGAADAGLRATIHDARAAGQSIAAQTAKAWLAWTEARAQVDVADATFSSLSRTLELVEARYQSGTASAFEVRLAEADRENAGALLSGRRETVARTVRQLEILCGRHPRGIAADFTARGAGLPAVPELPTVGVPAEILERRPDLAAAAERIAALDERLYAARVALYPTLRLAGSVGRVSDRGADLVDPEFDVWSIAAGLTQPLFQGGRLRAGADAAEARVQQALAGFAAQVLAAFGEVETLLAVESHLLNSERLVASAADRSAAALELARDRYSAGLVDLPTVLETERRTFDTESARLTAHRRRLDARIDLHLALGGGFGEWPVSAGPTQTANETLAE